MYGEYTEKDTIAKLDYILDNQEQEQFEILLYKKNSKYEFRNLKQLMIAVSKGRLGK